MSKFPPGYFWAKDYADVDLGLKSRTDINACHLIADILGGSGSNLANLATCSRGANFYRSNTFFAPMRAFERKVHAEASIPGQSVYYRVIPLYQGSRTVPTGFMLYAHSTTGWSDDITVGNVIVDQYGVPHNLGTATRSDGSIPVGATP